MRCVITLVAHNNNYHDRMKKCNKIIEDEFCLIIMTHTTIDDDSAYKKQILDAMKSRKIITSDKLQEFLDSDQNWVSTLKSGLKSIDPKIASLATCQSDEKGPMRYMDEVFQSIQESGNEQEVMKCT